MKTPKEFRELQGVSLPEWNDIIEKLMQAYSDYVQEQRTEVDWERLRNEFFDNVWDEEMLTLGEETGAELGILKFTEWLKDNLQQKKGY